VPAVQVIGNEEDLTQVDMSSVLSHSMVMVVTVTATTTSGRPLEPAQLAAVEDAAAHIVQLERDKEDLLTLVESRMNLLAPNLSALLVTATLPPPRAPPCPAEPAAPALTALRAVPPVAAGLSGRGQAHGRGWRPGPPLKDPRLQRPDPRPEAEEPDGPLLEASR